VVLSSRIDDGSGVIEVLLIPTDWAFADDVDNKMSSEGINKRLIQKYSGFCLFLTCNNRFMLDSAG
jgi:hypothetical protein